MDSNSCSVQSSSGGCGADEESYDSRTIGLHQQNPFFSHQQHLPVTSAPPSASSSSSSTCAAAATTGPTTMLNTAYNNNLLDHLSAGYLYYDPRSMMTSASAAFNLQADSHLSWPKITTTSTALGPIIHSDLHTTAMMSSSSSRPNTLMLQQLSPDAAVLGRSSNQNTTKYVDPNNNNNNAAPSRARPKKRSRASRRAPTTVLTTDTSNFRAMVQEFTGIPAPPFAATPLFTTGRFDLFGGGSSSVDALTSRHQEPISNMSSYLLRPFAHRPRPPPVFHHHQLIPNSATTTTTTTVNIAGDDHMSNNNATFSNFAHQQTNHTTSSTRADFATFTASLLQNGGGPLINKYVTRNYNEEAAAMQFRTSNERGGGLDEVIVGLGQPQLATTSSYIDDDAAVAASVDGLSK
ncbi:unnamed protein product [Rhodiola kirilowii]